MIVPCAGTGVTLLPLTKGGPSKCVSPCNLGLVLGYPERGCIFRCKTCDQGRMSTRYRYFDPEGTVRLANGAIGGAEDENFPSIDMGSRTSLRQYAALTARYPSPRQSPFDWRPPGNLRRRFPYLVIWFSSPIERMILWTRPYSIASGADIQ